MPDTAKPVSTKPKIILDSDSDSDSDAPLSKRLKQVVIDQVPAVPAPVPAIDDDDIPLAQKMKNLEVKANGNLLKSKKPTEDVKSTSASGTAISSTSVVLPKPDVKTDVAKSTSTGVSAAPKTVLKKTDTQKKVRRDSDDVPLSVKAKELKAENANDKKSTAVSKPKVDAKKVRRDSDDDVPLAMKAKEMKSKIAETKKKKGSSDEDDVPLSGKAKKSAIKKEPSDENDEEEGSQWWETYEPQDNTVKWSTLEHYGVCFPPEYIPHKVPLIYDGKELVLEPECEEVAGFFGALIQTDHAQNEIFVKNFFEDFKAILKEANSVHSHLIRDFEKCDFSLMHQHFERLKEKKKAMPKDEKEKLKADRASLIEQYGYCIIDGRKERIGNFMVEPPGLFRGRGKHPKAGKLKTRVRPEQITINIGKEAKIPAPPRGHSWGSIQHDNTVTWLATWVENINRAQKYVMLAPESSLKGKSDMEKFEKARKLKDRVKHIRKVNAEELRSKEMLVRQRATALWLIDHLALRAGNEKGDDEADTVGCCSLRIEHVKRVEPNILVFDFLGKDSIRYYNEVPVDPIIYKNIGIFMRPPKTATDLIFDRLTTSDLNKYLNGLMPGLTAKVFRTYNASFTFQQELEKTPAEGDVAEKILAYNRANRQVAILCNHQKSVSKTHGQSMDNMRRKVQHIKYQRHLVKSDLKELVGSKELKAELPEALDPESDLDEDTIQALQDELDTKEEERKAKKIKEKSEAGEDVSSLVEDSATKSPTKRARSTNKESLMKKFNALTTRINAAKLQLIDKDENKTTSLGTSKTNYIDPRITVAWCGAHDVPVEKLFTQTLRKKFQWSMSVPKNWKF